MDDKTIRRVAIVGGGSAGWLAALYLQQHLGRRTEIAVVTPRDGMPMSVGESTNGPFTGFLEGVAITKEDILRECGGTLKIASEFAHWNRPGVGYDWVHEFQDTETIHGIPLYHYWHAQFLAGETARSYQDTCFANAQLVRAQRVPFAATTAAPDFHYGYHLDSNRFATLVKARALAAGVRWIDSEVVDVAVEAGWIRRLVLTAGDHVEADFYLDASGFRRRLVRSVVEGTTSRFVSLRDRLPCDSAVYARYGAKDAAIRPSTLGTALSSGWCWDIPLSDSVSVGYVYSSAHLDAVRAEEELRRTCRLSQDVPIKSMKWEPGMYDEPWTNNCVAIGVAAGFVDPIESLTSATLTVELKNLLVNFPNSAIHRASRERYNGAARAQYEANVNFIALHYFSATRADSAFWTRLKQPDVLSRHLQNFLSNFAEQAPLDAAGIYSVKGVSGLLSSRGVVPKDPYPLLAYAGDWRRAEAVFARIADRQKKVCDGSMDHRAFVEAICRDRPVRPPRKRVGSARRATT